MDRFIPSDGVEVRASHLKATNDAVAYHIQRRLSDGSRAGIASGLRVGVDGTAQFSITAGRAYTARGDLIEVPTSITAISLSDYTTSVASYLCLVYRETTSQQAAHESDGTSRATIASGSYDVLVLLESEYNALSETDGSTFKDDVVNADLTTNTTNRIVILARILGKGYTAGAPNGYVTGDLTNGNVTQQAEYTATLTAAVVGTPTVLGVNIKSVGDDNPTTASLGGVLGELTLVVSSSGTVRTMSWAAPGDTAGTGVVLATSGIDTVTLTSNDAVSTLTLECAVEIMSKVDGTYDDDISVSVFYNDYGPQFSVSDALHRSKMGSLVPTAINPHGMGHQDFGQQVVNMNVPVVVGDDYFGAEKSLQARITTQAGSSQARTLLWQMTGGAGDAHIRFWKDNSDQLEVTWNADFDGTTYVRDDVTRSYQVLLGETALSCSINEAGGSTFSTWSEIFNTKMQGGSSLLQMGIGFLASNATALTSRVNMPYSNSSGGIIRTLIWESRGGTTTGRVVRVYRTNGVSASGATDPFELVYNAAWNSGTNRWDRDSAADSTKIEVGDACAIYHRLAGSSNSWLDSYSLGGWENRSFQCDSSGNVTILGDVDLDSDLDVTGNVDIGGTLTAGTLVLETDTPAAPVTQTLYRDLMPRFWGRVHFTTTNGSPASTIDTSFSFGGGVQYGPGIDSVSIASTGTPPNSATSVKYMTVNLETGSAFSNADAYIVKPTLEIGTEFATGSNQSLGVFVENVNGTQFRLWLCDTASWDPVDIDISDDLNRTDRYITFLGFGKQSL